MVRSTVSFTAALGCALLTGCASPQPVAYTGLSAASYLKPQADGGPTPYRYSAGANWAGYSKVIIDRVDIYQGPDNQFGDMSVTDKAALAQYMQEQFAIALGKRFTITNMPGADTLRVKLTLTGAETTGLIGIFAHIDMAGNLYNGIQAVRGKEGLNTGWVMYAVEVSNSTTGKLLEAFEEKQYPNAFNIAAAFGSLSAAKTGLDKGADHLAAQLK